MEHEVKGGGVRLPSAKAKTYQMYLTIDGQKHFRSTETSDYDDAIDKLRSGRYKRGSGIARPPACDTRKFATTTSPAARTSDTLKSVVAHRPFSAILTSSSKTSGCQPSVDG